MRKEVFILLVILSVTVFSIPKNSALKTDQQTLSDDMCSTPDAYSTAIVWHDRDVNQLHLVFSVNKFNQGDCVQFRLVNGDINDDGSYVHHEFDIEDIYNPSLGFTFYQEYNQNSTIRIVQVLMPNMDIDIFVNCGTPGHTGLGENATLQVGLGSNPYLQPNTLNSVNLIQPSQTVSPDMCSAPDAYSNAIVWANDLTGDWHLNFTKKDFTGGDCVGFRLINAAIATDGSFANHDFDIQAQYNPDLGFTFHQSFNRNSTVRIANVLMPDINTTIIVDCGLPGHHDAGERNVFTIEHFVESTPTNSTTNSTQSNSSISSSSQEVSTSADISDTTSLTLPISMLAIVPSLLLISIIVNKKRN